LDSWSSDWYLAMDFFICFHQSQDEGSMMTVRAFSQLTTGVGQFSLFGSSDCDGHERIVPVFQVHSSSAAAAAAAADDDGDDDGGGGGDDDDDDDD
ncbi:hypothetical protein STEG23_035779, partial [Scotinomys teguina]